MNVRIIANPISGGGRGKRAAEALENALRERGEHVELALTQGPGDCTAFAREEGADCLVAVGGDGTINEIVNGMDRSRASLAILPMGTANVVARELRIRKDSQFVADLIASGTTRTLDAGRCNDRLFLLGVGAGLDAAVTARVSAQRGRRSSYLEWVVPAIRTVLSYTYPPMRVTVDDKLVAEDAQYVVVGNCRLSAAIFPVTPRAVIDDGLLDVTVFRRLNAGRIIKFGMTVWSESFLDHPDVIGMQGRTFAIEPAANDAAPLQIDGDPAGTIPATIRVEPAAVRVFAPG